jgi:hypothetical protein
MMSTLLAIARSQSQELMSFGELGATLSNPASSKTPSLSPSIGSVMLV